MLFALPLTASQYQYTAKKKRYRGACHSNYRLIHKEIFLSCFLIG